MKNQLMAAAAVLALMSASTVASASEQTDVKTLKAQAAQLKKQNASLEKRLNAIETKQAAAPQQPAATDFVGMVTKGPLAIVEDEGPICWKGICIFGTVDAGLGYATHGAPNSKGFYTGDTLIQPYYNRSNFGILPNGLSNSTIGIKGKYEIIPGWSGVFYASTGFNPQSGYLSDAPGSQVENNGIAPAYRSMNGDGTRGGQAFNDQLYVGLSSDTFGTLTFGRHKTFSNDMIGVYDPAGGAYNYSPIGFSGTPVAGMGFTDDGRIDNTLKYKIEYGPVHFGALYKFIDGTAGNAVTVVGGNNVYTPLKTANDGYQFNLGGKMGGFELDGVYSHFNQAITYGTLGVGSTAVGALTFQNTGLNMLSATAADLDSFVVAGKYTWDQWKFYAGFAYDTYNNPQDPIGFGANLGQGGYRVITASNASFNREKDLDTEWAGVKYAWDPKTDITVAYYHEGQANFTSTAATAASCANARSTLRSSACGGDLNAVSAYVDYHFTKRFDVYGGFMYSAVSGGFASGYIATDNFVPSAGARFSF